MPWAQARGARIHYQLLGPADGQPLVLLRGLARSARYWLGFHELLAQRFRIVLVDNRGVGFSDATRPPYTTSQMADDVIAVLDDAGIRRAHLFGISLGGMIAQWTAAKYPHRIDRLVLGCTTGGGRAGSGATVDAMAALLRGGTMPFHEAMRHTAPWVVAPHFLEARPEVIDRWVAIAVEEPPRFAGLLGQLWAGARHDCSRHLRRIRSETLVLTGDADRLIPAINSYRLVERIPQARIRVLGRAGHDFPTELPEQTAEIVGDFVHRGALATLARRTASS